MRIVVAVAFACVSQLATAQASPNNTCVLSPDERTWIETSLAASRFVRTEKLHLTKDSHATIILFNASCRFEGKDEPNTKWAGTPHSGKIRIPDGDDIPAGVTSSTGKNDKTGQVFFVMALPSVWKAAGVKGALPDSVGLKAVFVHEFLHVTQLPIIQPLFDSAGAHFTTPPNLDDDAVQKHFQSDPITSL